jgi:hypothetical protein
MVLAADHGDRAVLVEPAAGVAPGTFAEGTDASARTIAYEEFAAIPLRVGRVTGPEGAGATRVDLGDREVVVPGEWTTGTVLVVRLAAADAGTGEVVGFGPGRPVRVTEEIPLGAKVR